MIPGILPPPFKALGLEKWIHLFAKKKRGKNLFRNPFFAKVFFLRLFFNCLCVRKFLRYLKRGLGWFLIKKPNPPFLPCSFFWGFFGLEKKPILGLPPPTAPKVEKRNSHFNLLFFFFKKLGWEGIFF